MSKFIDADSLKAKLKKRIIEICNDSYESLSNSTFIYALYEVIDEIERLQEIPCEIPLYVKVVKHGQWIGVNPMVDTLMCSECGENILGEEFKSRYCPNCGAKMDGFIDEIMF